MKPLKPTRKFTLEFKWESCDRSDEELIGTQIVEVDRLKNSDAELKTAITIANRVLMAQGGYERGKITSVFIYDATMREILAVLSINQNEETNQVYHCELSEGMQTLMWFLFQVPSLKLSEIK